MVSKNRTMRDRTQDECQSSFYVLCNETIAEIDNINNNTPFSITEPQWWLKMMDIRKQLQDACVRTANKAINADQTSAE